LRVLLLGSGDLCAQIAQVLKKADGDKVLEAQNLTGARLHLASGQIDWIVSAGFRYILEKSDLDLAGATCNVHTSLLPWGRGANPNVWAIAAAEPAGVSIHEMTPTLDGGPLFAQREIATRFSDTGLLLHRRLQDAAVQLFSECWEEIRSGMIKPRPQPSGGSFHRRADMKALGEIDLDETVTFRYVLDVLRAMTFPPYRNAVVEIDESKFFIELSIYEEGKSP
jgi:methionyl-tRNA formyltransferase